LGKNKSAKKQVEKKATTSGKGERKKKNNAHLELTGGSGECTFPAAKKKKVP